jgi:peroxiredoxin
MSLVQILALTLAWAAILGICCLGWQLLRQNGRILLRLDELEKRFDELEFEPGDESLDESQRRAPPSVRPEAGRENNGAQGTDAPYPDNRASRFSNHSLARGKIKRDGLKAGTAAPNFCLPRLDGRGDLTLNEMRGKQVLLVFSSPGCGPCNTLAPELEKFHRQHRELEMVMISRGEPKENRTKVQEHGLTFPVVLQQQWEISRRYAMFATPIAYLIDEAGVISHDVAVGVEPILALLTVARRHVGEKGLATG